MLRRPTCPFTGCIAGIFLQIFTLFMSVPCLCTVTAGILFLGTILGSMPKALTFKTSRYIDEVLYPARLPADIYLFSAAHFMLRVLFLYHFFCRSHLYNYALISCFLYKLYLNFVLFGSRILITFFFLVFSLSSSEESSFGFIKTSCVTSFESLCEPLRTGGCRVPPFAAIPAKIYAALIFSSVSVRNSLFLRPSFSVPSSLPSRLAFLVRNEWIIFFNTLS